MNATSHIFKLNGSFTFIATDEAGNKSTKKVTIKNIDKAAPVIKVKDGSGKTVKKNGTVKKKASLFVSDTNLQSKEIKLNGKKLRWTSKVSKKGTYVVTAKDKAGNSSSFKFKVK